MTPTQEGIEMDTAGNNWALSQPTPGATFLLNTRLVAAVQTRAGAHCHESANLLQAYYFRADVYRAKLRNKGAVAAEAARRNVQQAEARLRQFLTNQLWPCPLGESRDNRLTRDCHAVAC
jgi:hypothetical protein